MNLLWSSIVEIFSATSGYISFGRKLIGLHATDVLRTGRSAGAVLCWMFPHTMYPEHTKAHVSGPASRYSRTTQCRNECTCLAVTRSILQLGHAPSLRAHEYIHTSAARGWPSAVAPLARELAKLTNTLRAQETSTRTAEAGVFRDVTPCTNTQNYRESR